MKLLVLTKQVPESQATRMDEKTGTLIREAASSVINPLDLHALECALTLKETLQEEVDVTCLSMGADHGVLLSGREFAGSDTWCTGYSLALAAKKIGPFDLIICGERATDGETGQTGPAMATFLELPAVTFVSAVERCDGGWRVRRMLEDGYETVEIDGPALLCVLKEASIPRLPTLQGKRRARGMDIVTLTAEDVGASKEDVGLNASPTRVVKIFRPVHIKDCEKLPAQDAEGAERAVERVVELLKSKKII